MFFLMYFLFLLGVDCDPLRIPIKLLIEGWDYRNKKGKRFKPTRDDREITTVMFVPSSMNGVLLSLLENVENNLVVSHNEDSGIQPFT